jgi:hypothetical protein
VGEYGQASNPRQVNYPIVGLWKCKRQKNILHDKENIVCKLYANRKTTYEIIVVNG